MGLIHIASINSWHRSGDKCAFRCRPVPSLPIYASQRHWAGEYMVERAVEGGNCALVRKLHGTRGWRRGSRTTRHQADWHSLAPRPSDLANSLASVGHLHIVRVAEKLDNPTRSHESIAIVNDRVCALNPGLFWQLELLHAGPVQVPHLTLVTFVHRSGTAGKKYCRQCEQIRAA